MASRIIDRPVWQPSTCGLPEKLYADKTAAVVGTDPFLPFYDTRLFAPIIVKQDNAVALQGMGRSHAHPRAADIMDLSIQCSRVGRPFTS